MEITQMPGSVKLAIARDEINTLIIKAGLTAKLRIEAPQEWKLASKEIPYKPVAYSESMMDYMVAYFLGNGQQIVDISLVLQYDQKVCGIWPLSLNLSCVDKIGSNGGSILPPLFVSKFPKKSQKSVVKGCLKLLSELSERYGQEVLRSEEVFNASTGISEWHLQVMERGATAQVGHDLFVELSLPMVEIRANFRKSYKSLINYGLKCWSVKILSEKDDITWERFRALHQYVAEKVTRSKKTWDMQHKAIVDGKAFLVYLESSAGDMVGGGLFHTTRQEALYAVGAYDRNLFDKPLGHVVQYAAIEEMKNRGILWYCIGGRPFQSDTPKPTPKEVSIAEFKQGFATHVHPRYKLIMPSVTNTKF